jgi:hypothetical protein
MKIIKETHLHYQKGTSNKVYNVYLVEVSQGSYLVNFEYGRFGATLREGSKTTTPVELAKAEKIYDSLVVAKVNKEYKLLSGYNSLKQEDKVERKPLANNEYEALLLSRLQRAKDENLATVDNYVLSRLIYKAGELKLEEAKDVIVSLYAMEVEETNAFYYAVVWALGRYRDSRLRSTIESAREKLDTSSLYIVDEALFLLQEDPERKEIEALTFPAPFSIPLKNRNVEAFLKQVKLLEELVNETYSRYKNVDAWYEDEREAIKNELMPLVKKVDELYLKLYLFASVDSFMHEALRRAVVHFPVTEFNFSLYRRLYKMADMRDDHEVLAGLITKIESKKMACYSAYDNEWNPKPSLGCSRLYFKKRSLRYLKKLATYKEENYLSLAKNILLSMNDYPSEFKAFTTEYYDENWNYKVKKHDAFSTHLTFMYILYGAGKRYMLSPSKKQWETANKSIKDEHRVEMHKEIWDKHPKVALEVLAKSSVNEVQTFAYAVVKDNKEVIERASLSLLVPLLSLHGDEARAFFFELLKERYAKAKELELLQGFLLSNDDNIAEYGLSMVETDIGLLEKEGLVTALSSQCSKYIFVRLLLLLEKVKNPKVIVAELMEKLLTTPLPLEVKMKERYIKMLRKLHKGIEPKDIERLFEKRELSDVHLIGAKLIRCPEFDAFEYSLELKEKIAQYENHQMLATTIYLLGRLSDEELMRASEMLVTFLYNTDKPVHEESSKIIVRLGKEPENGKILLKAIVEKSFLSASDEVADNVVNTVKALNESYAVIEHDQLYRMLIAKSKLAVRLGGLILSHCTATDFSVVQWARLAKNPNKSVRLWAYDAYMNNEALVKEAMPKSLMIFDTHWEDTRAFASGYFESFEMNTDDIVVVADSNYEDVQLFAKKMIERGDFDKEVLLTKLSQHPAQSIQKFVTDLMLGGMSDEQLLKMERFFNTLLHSVNQNRIAKTRVMMLLNERLESEKIAQMYARLASHHSATMVWADKEVYVEAMSVIAEKYPNIELPLSIENVEEREVV